MAPRLVRPWCLVGRQVEADHLEMAGVWKSLDAELSKLSRGAPADLRQETIDRFATMYHHHIDAEERVLLPALKRVLHRSDWTAVGRAMAERRGLEWDEIAKPTVKGRLSAERPESATGPTPP